MAPITLVLFSKEAEMFKERMNIKKKRKVFHFVIMKMFFIDFAYRKMLIEIENGTKR